MSLLQKAADALRNDKTGHAEVSAETLKWLAMAPSERLPTSQIMAWEVSSQHPGRDGALRVQVSVVVAGSGESARAKVARLGEFPEKSIRSVHQIDTIARFADSAAQLVGSARENVSGYYDVDETLLKQARTLALLVCQQLV